MKILRPKVVPYKEKYPPARTTRFGRATWAGHFFDTLTYTKFTFKVARLVTTNRLAVLPTESLPPIAKP
jgi:hypothetical protein